MAFIKRSKAKKAHKLQQTMDETRRSIFGQFDMSERKELEVKGYVLRLGKFVVSEGSWKVTVDPLCKTCQSVDNDQSLVWYSTAPWEAVKAKHSRECALCSKVRYGSIKIDKTMLENDDQKRAHLTRTIKTYCRTDPCFTGAGILDHDKFEWITNGGWMPTCIAQDGSTEALEKLHKLAYELGVNLRAVDGFLVFPQVHVLSAYRREECAKNIEQLTAHAKRMPASALPVT